MTSLHQQSDLGGEAEGRPIRRSLLGWLVALYQGDKVGVADLGVLPCYPEMSDAAAGDTTSWSWLMEMAWCV